MPRYISTVDSGNFVGYLYTTKTFLENLNLPELNTYIECINKIINATDFSLLYDKEKQIFL